MERTGLTIQQQQIRPEKDQQQRSRTQQERKLGSSRGRDSPSKQSPGQGQPHPPASGELPEQRHACTLEHQPPHTPFIQKRSVTDATSACANSLCGLLLHLWRESKPGEDDGGSDRRRHRSVRTETWPEDSCTLSCSVAWVAIDTVLEPCRPRSRPACCRSPTASRCPSPQH